MGKWRRRLYGYTGLALVLGLWSPLASYIADARGRYDMTTFDVLRMHPIDIALFIALCAATLMAQFGFIVIAHDMAEYHRKKQESQGGQDERL